MITVVFPSQKNETTSSCHYSSGLELPTSLRHARLTGVRHDAQVSLFIVVQQLVHVEDGVFLVRNVEPGGHDGGPSQHHPPPFLLWSLLRLKHVLHRFPDHGVR